MMREILKRVWEEEHMQEVWKKSEIVPIYKQKGDPLECGNFRGIKLLEHGMNMFGLLDLVDRKIRQMQYLSHINCKKNHLECTRICSLPL